nr:immunoglobulin heavy chain junction region [Mus musculus]MBK4195859.1 immunoglobulin heavy chain junction region [Mus musculus]
CARNDGYYAFAYW